MMSLPTRFIILCMVVLCATICSGDVWADPTPTPDDFKPTDVDHPFYVGGGMSDYCRNEGAAEDTLFTRIIGCLERSVMDSALWFIDVIYPPFVQAVTTAMVLAAILYGCLLAIGSVERIARDTMFFIFKLGGVMYFMTYAQEIYLEFTNMLMGTLNEISNVTVYFADLRCPSSALPPSGTTIYLWQRADCIFDMVIGLSANAALGGSGGTTHESLSRGMAGFFFYNLQSGALGMMIGLVGLYICFNLLMALLKASYTYIIALIILSFLFIIGFIFVPLIMFKNSFEYFSRWVKMVLAMILQPLILFAYLNVLFVAFDVMLVSGTNSLMSVITGGPVAKDFNIHEFMDGDPSVPDDGYYTQNSQGFTMDLDQKELATTPPGENDGILGNINFTDAIPDYDKYLSELPIHLRYQTVDYDKLESATGAGAGEIAGATLLVGLASYILLSFMANIPAMAHDLSGGAYETPNIIAGASSGVSLPFAQTTQGLVGRAGQGFRDQLNTGIGLRR